MIFDRLDLWEKTACVTINRACSRPSVKKFFSLISRIGDGIIWYAMLVVVPLLFGWNALKVSLHMFLVGLACVAIYKVLKKKLTRERPYITHSNIQLGTNPLDAYSFPSGHTLHAVAFTALLITYYPILAVVLLPFAVLVALSRIILGLHYPSDVVIGGLIGYAITKGSFYLVNYFTIA